MALKRCIQNYMSREREISKNDPVDLNCMLNSYTVILLMSKIPNEKLIIIKIGCSEPEWPSQHWTFWFAFRAKWLSVCYHKRNIKWHVCCFASNGRRLEVFCVWNLCTYLAAKQSGQSTQKEEEEEGTGEAMRRWGFESDKIAKMYFPIACEHERDER